MSNETAEKILKKFLREDKLEHDKTGKDALPPIRKAPVVAPAPTKPTTSGWKPMKK